MRVLGLALVVVALFLLPETVAGQPLPSDCQRWEECRDQALEARARGQFERFHDLAWRAVQTGPRNDPAPMYLLARAQALSGRRRDALIMLRRLADLGVATEAAIEEDFRRVRELAGWAEIERTFERLRAGPGANSTVAESARSTSPSPSPAPPSAPPPAAASALPAPSAAPAASASAASPSRARASAPPVALTIDPLPAIEVAQFSTDRFTPAGLAYDEVSRRFVFGDTAGRRLFVVGEGSTRTVDLVRAESAGFQEVTALAIDGKRGDLWVTSTAPGGTAGTIHRLQLISGRAIGSLDAPAVAQLALRDLAVAANGTVLVLDDAGRRILRVRPGSKSVEPVMAVDISDPVSFAVGDTDRVVWVAHKSGIIRLDLQTKAAREMTAPAGLLLSGFERIRWHRNTLVGIQTLPDGSRALVLLRLDRNGVAVTGGSVIEPSLDRNALPPLLTIVGDDAYYSVIGGAASAARPALDVVVRRVRLP